MYRYNVDDNSLYLALGKYPVYDLKIRAPLTVVYGDSGTGKSLLCSLVKLCNTQLYLEGKDPQVLFLNISEGLNLLNEDPLNKLVIVDNADILLPRSEEFCMRFTQSFLRGRPKGRYLVFSRGCIDLHITPNYYAEFVQTDGVISLKYLTSNKEWF
jgi:hypothetical protein